MRTVWIANSGNYYVMACAVLVLTVGLGRAGDDQAVPRPAVADQSKSNHDPKQQSDAANQVLPQAGENGPGSVSPASGNTAAVSPHAGNDPESFHVGSFLVASPGLPNTKFARSVILLIQQDANGTLGLVVNRPTHFKGAPFPVFAGGPCPTEGLTMLHGHAEWQDRSMQEPLPPVAPGIYLGDEAALKRATETPGAKNSRFRVFMGYAGWGPGQLKGEIAAGAWTVVPATGQLLFETDVDALWDRLAQPRIAPPGGK